MKDHMALRMNNGNLKMVNYTQTSAVNADMGKTAFNLVQSVIIERLLAFFLWIPLKNYSLIELVNSLIELRNSPIELANSLIERRNSLIECTNY
jgi:hypothetical protein